MNPFFPQQNQGLSPFAPQYQQQNLQPSVGQPTYPVANPYQAQGWPGGYVMPGYALPYQTGQFGMQVPMPQQQQQVSQAAVQNTVSNAPPLPKSKPPTEVAPLPPPPDEVPNVPAPPPPEEEPSQNEAYKGRQIHYPVKENTSAITSSSQGEESASVNYKSAISSLAVSKQLANSNDDLLVLNKQLLQLENQMKKYQSEYEKWFKEFSAWRKQHENHPDQKQYIEYQQKYQKMIEQQQLALKEQYIELQNRIKTKKLQDKSTVMGSKVSKPMSYAGNQQGIFNQSTGFQQTGTTSNNMTPFTAASNIVSNTHGNQQGSLMSNFTSPGFQRSANEASFYPKQANLQETRSQMEAGISKNTDRKPFLHQNCDPFSQAGQREVNQQGHNDFNRRIQDDTAQSQYQKGFQEQQGFKQDSQPRYPYQVQRGQPQRGNVPRFQEAANSTPTNISQSGYVNRYQGRFQSPQQIRQQGPPQGAQQSLSQTPFQRQPGQPMTSQTGNQDMSHTQNQQFTHVRHPGSTAARLPNNAMQSRFQSPRFQSKTQGGPARSQQLNHASSMTESNQQNFQGNRIQPEANRNVLMASPSALQKQSNFATKDASKIPSLMSQAIPKRDYYDDEVEEDTEKNKDNIQGQNEEDMQVFGSANAREMASEEPKRGQNANSNMKGEDFASDDIADFKDWEDGSEDILPNQPPLSPKSMIKRNFGNQNTPGVTQLPPNTQRFAAPLQGDNRSQSRFPARGVSQRPNFTPRSSLTFSPGQRTVRSSQPRAPFGRGQVRPAFTSRQLERPVRGTTASGLKPSPLQNINTAPPVEPPKEGVSKGNANASIQGKPEVAGQKTNATLQQSGPQGSQRFPRQDLQQGKSFPQQGSSIGNILRQGSQGSHVANENESVKDRLPSLVHQHANNTSDTKKVICKFFPNCKFGKACKFKHQICPESLYCEKSECIYDHPQLSKAEIDDIQQKMRERKAAQRGQNVNRTFGPSRDSGGFRQPVQNLSSGIRDRVQQGGRTSFEGYYDDPNNKNNEAAEGMVVTENENQQGMRYGGPDYQGSNQTAVGDHRGGNYGLRNDFKGNSSYFEKQVPHKDIHLREKSMSNERNSAKGLSSDRHEDILPQKDSGTELSNTELNKDGQPGPNDANLIDKDQSQESVGHNEGDKALPGSQLGPDVSNKERLEPNNGEEDRGSNSEDIRDQNFHQYPGDPSLYRERMGPPDVERDWQRAGRERPLDERYENHEGGIGRRTFEDYDRPAFRDDYGRPPLKDDPERLPLRDEPYRYPPGDEASRYGPRQDDLRTRDERSRYPRDYARGVSPPRWETFHDQFEFERRYRDWEKQHFPIDDPTREWEYELRRRELLGATIPPPRLPERDYPPRDYYPYGRPVRPRDPFDVRPDERYYPGDRLPPRDPYLERGREGFRPAVFDYDHSRKGEAGRPVSPSQRPLSPRPLSPTQLSPRRLAQRESSLRGLSPRRLSPRGLSPRRLSPSRLSPQPGRPRSSSPSSKRGDRPRSSERKRSSPSRHSRSPLRSRSPNRHSSPRRGRRSRSPRRRSRSPHMRTKSPSRRSSSRRSPSPKRRDRSPHDDRRRSSHDRMSIDRSYSRDSYDRDRYGTPLHKDNIRSSDQRRDSRLMFEDPYYSRMEEIKQPMEIKPAEPAPEIVAVKDLLDPPGRETRPKQIVIILRGLPGCGKTHIAKIIKDKEVSYGSPAPRILALDDYFIQETDVYQKDPDTGKKIKVKKMEYVYEEEMEAAYRVSLLKSFNKTLDNGYFPMVIIDAVNDKVAHFQKFWSDGKHKGFEVFIAEMHGDVQVCAEKNIHNWTQDSIQKISDSWEQTPNHFKRLDVRSLVQDAAIEEVEMEEVEQPAVEAEPKKENDDEEDDDDDVDEEDLGTFHIPKKSKWEETKDEQLAKLDGIRHDKKKKNTSVLDHDDDYDVYDDDPYDEREEDMRIGKKRVRWADIEERKQLEHRKRIGFCIGTDWSVLTDPNAQVPL